MSRRLVLRKSAEDELAEAVDWYEGQRTGLGCFHGHRDPRDWQEQRR